MQFEKKGGVEETAKNLQRALFESVGGHAGGYEGVIVRPDRSIVIRHGIKASLSDCDGSDTPSTKKLLIHQGFGRSHAVLWVSNTGPETVAGIRRLDSTRLLEPVQSQRIGREVVAPEVALELSA